MNRKQYVYSGNSRSDIKELHTGLPQGSMMSALYINGLFELKLNGKTEMYADDAVIMQRDSNGHRGNPVNATRYYHHNKLATRKQFAIKYTKIKLHDF